MQKNAKRSFAAVAAAALLALPAFAADDLPCGPIAPEVNENTVNIGCVSAETLGNITFETDEKTAEPGKSFGFGLRLGENWVLRGIEIFDADKNPVDFDITGIYRYSFTVPETGAKIKARSEDHSPATRAESVMSLWKLAGEPVVDYLMIYTDVDAESEYSEAIRWAASEGLITVTDKFRPDDPVTREELAVVIYRGAEKLGLDTDEDCCKLLDSVDRDSVSEWALEAVCWNVANGVMNEFSGASGYFKPQEYMTRNDLSEAIDALVKLGKKVKEPENSERSDDAERSDTKADDEKSGAEDSGAKRFPSKCPPINIGFFPNCN